MSSVVKIHITFYFEIVCFTNESYAIYVQKLHGLLKHKTNFESIFSKVLKKYIFFKIEQPSNNGRFHDLIKNNNSNS